MYGWKAASPRIAVPVPELGDISTGCYQTPSGQQPFNHFLPSVGEAVLASRASKQVSPVASGAAHRVPDWSCALRQSGVYTAVPDPARAAV